MKIEWGGGGGGRGRFSRDRMSALKREIWGDAFTPTETSMRGWQRLWFEARIHRVPL